MSRPFERVYTVNEFYDGPRAGFADCDGAPHVYTSHWSEALDDWSPDFTLRPISAELLTLALEDWAIWRRWETAFRAGETTVATHPALPADATRHAELAPLIEAALTFGPTEGFPAEGEFKLADSDLPPALLPSSERWLVVRWTRKPFAHAVAG
jgi:hypothetical protein